VKSNLSGEFTIVNEYLVADLKKLGLWDEVMVADLKYFDGNLARIDRIPSDFASPLRPRVRSRTGVGRRSRRAAAEMDRPVPVAQHLHRAGLPAGSWTKATKLAWQRGLKTTYYLRSMGATHAEEIDR